MSAASDIDKLNEFVYYDGKTGVNLLKVYVSRISLRILKS